MPDDLRALTDEQLAERLERMKRLGVADSFETLDEAARRLRQRQTTEQAPEKFYRAQEQALKVGLSALGLWRDPVQEPSHD